MQFVKLKSDLFMLQYTELINHNTIRTHSRAPNSEFIITQ